jgi:hypothetical protein
MSWPGTLFESIRPGLLSGITFSRWFRLLRHNRFAISVRRWPRATVITAGSLGNSLGALFEEAVFARRVRSVEVEPPLFVLGVWRSGTTHLQNLLALDHRFAYCTTYQMLFPHTFLTTEALFSGLFAFLVPEKRPQDNVAQGLPHPAEDEAMFCVTTFQTPYLSWVFPRNRSWYDRFLTFTQTDEEELREWGAALTLFLKKLTWKHGRPLILKSPFHTGRIRLLLDLFPEAKFVTIHRHPLAVFRSSLYTVAKTCPRFSLQYVEDEGQWQDHLFRQYRQVTDAYFEQRHLIPAGRLCEVSYEELEKNPFDVVRKIYRRLGLPEFEGVETKLRQYLASLGHYQKNKLPPLKKDFEKRILKECKRPFEEWGYAGTPSG